MIREDRKQLKGNILIVDDKIDNLRLLSGMLSKEGYQLRAVKNGEVALKVVEAKKPDLILLDIMMPGMDGYQVCQQLKANPNTREIPVIFLSAINEAKNKVKSFEVGGADYITKPFQLAEVLIRVKNQLTLYYLNRELEKKVKERTAELEKINQKLKKEIEERQEYQKQLLHKTLHDELTELPNRTFFLKQIKTAMAGNKNNLDRSFAVMVLDCDRFRSINDSLGHHVGDKLLIAVADRLKYCLRDRDTIARLGGDEFAILLNDLEDINNAANIAEEINSELSLPFYLAQKEVFINASIGIVLNTSEYQQPETILRDADTAMYRAKERGKGCYQIFESHMHDRAQKVLELETDLRLAIVSEEFSIHYQPIVCLNTNKISGFEALLRWKHPEKGNISPGKFIPVAEETGLIIPIGMWILRQACLQLKTWQNRYQNKGLTMSVNLSVKQFSQPDLLEQIDLILAETQLDSRSLKLEITESAIMDCAESATKIVEEIKSRQIQLSLDDFGTGYSSLSYLHRFPVDTLKIDRSFIFRLGQKAENLKIVQAIVNLAHNLSINVVAEGIETETQLEQLKAIECQFAQGYFFSKPLDAKSVESLLEKELDRNIQKQVEKNVNLDFSTSIESRIF